MNKSNFINNKWCHSPTGKPFQKVNPANSKVIIFSSLYANADLSFEAVEAANKSWAMWKNIKLNERIEYLYRLIRLLDKNRTQLAEIITLENGKLFNESLQEISASILEGNYQLEFLTNNLIEKVGDHEIRYEPTGSSLLITPWNFPIATILRKLIPTLALGNTAIVKASENTPLTSVTLFKIIEEVGFPPGVVNLLNGFGSELIPQIIKSNKIATISFTGSTKNGKKIFRNIGGKLIKYQAEMGGNNTVLILNDSNLDLAISSVVSNSFACCGQWCTGTGRILVEEKIFTTFKKKLISAVNNLNPGNGMDKKSTIGPLISDSQLLKTNSAVKLAKKNGAEIILGGKRINSEDLKYGYFYEPTILSNIKDNMQIFDEEIFGPVISIIKVKNAKDGINILNKSRYGLSFSVYGKNRKILEEIVTKVETGLSHINLPTTYRDVALPLLGWKDSGYGIAESGRFARDFFSRTKAIYRN